MVGRRILDGGRVELDINKRSMGARSLNCRVVVRTASLERVWCLRLMICCTILLRYLFMSSCLDGIFYLFIALGSVFDRSTEAQILIVKFYRLRCSDNRISLLVYQYIGNFLRIMGQDSYSQRRE